MSLHQNTCLSAHVDIHNKLSTSLTCVCVLSTVNGHVLYRELSTAIQCTAITLKLDFPTFILSQTVDVTIYKLGKVFTVFQKITGRQSSE